MSRRQIFAKLLLMEIRFLGLSCFQIKGKKATVVTDPYHSSFGLKLPKASADIVTISHDHDDHNFFEAVSGTARRNKPFVISKPGEYEVAGVSIFGLPSFHDASKGRERGKNIIYVIEQDGLKLVHLGDLGHFLDDELLEEINGVDILFVPVGGVYTLNAKQAAEQVNKIHPKITIPMHFKMGKVTLDVAPVDDFLKELGEEKKQAVDKLIISYDKLPEEGETVVLNAKA